MFNLEIKYVEILNPDINLNDSINNLTFSKLQSNIEDIVIFVSMNDDNKLKYYIKKLLRYRKYLLKKHNIKIFFQSVNNDNLIHKQFIELAKVICYGDKYEIYSKAYDLACEYLDSFFYGKNLCDFCNNKCGYKKDYDIEVGCCRHFEKHRQFGMLLGEKLVNCEYLGKDGRCKIKCMGCKLYTCSYLGKKGVKFKQKDIFPIDSIFNWRQKIYLKSIVYRPKEYILKRIMYL